MAEKKTGVMAMRAAIDAKVKKIDQGTKELLGEAKRFRNEIKRYRKEDVGKYVNDFWYE